MWELEAQASAMGWDWDADDINAEDDMASCGSP